jgi:hypothetical protein
VTSNDVLQAFTDAASARMAAPVMAYYDIVDKYGADSTQALIALSATRLDLERAVRDAHIDAAVLASAGQLSNDATAITQDIISTDTYYVERLADDLPGLSRAQALIRANMYVSTQRNTINEIATLDLPVLPMYPKDARLICTYHCTCMLNVRYLYGSGNWDIFWNLDPQVQEACEDCIRLAAEWRPLQIRNGQIVNYKSAKLHDILQMKAVLDYVLKRSA